ncbi:PPE family protein [Mycobacterium haemophilum DSM 44634]|uniref:PPE family protein, SVP subgroup n=1 Tax=Mycobacterium haemophilum TaxID=29311 RepID=UPI0006556C00|nr:PPE domain-containing protein [Mycobacterium haemophilum]AKN15668.1 hypothetical protein B586_02390 [Mycobacterium haemophilum DSM 44634]MCV7341252.1 PPE domain-containing protein [Mycobacterium haemophilum DSM 44634]
MDFASLPPEINSARMYAGPGAGPMLAAAAAWGTLAAELHSTASSYQAAIGGLIAGPWLGPAAAAMTAAVAPYVAWLSMTAELAEQTANQAIAAAAAYEAAFSETVPPPVVAANRSLLMVLVATNFFSQNAPLIAATEMLYAEMWAQDTGAMYSYANASASATSLTSFTPPPSSTNPGGQAGEAAAVAQAAGTSAGNAQRIVASVPQAAAAVPNALQALAAQALPAAVTPQDVLDLLGNLVAILFEAPVDSLGLPAFAYDLLGYDISAHTDDIISGWAGIQTFPGTGPAPPTPFPVLTNPGSPAIAALGEAGSIGGLSVPTSWATAAPEARLLAVALPATSVGAAAEASAGGVGSLFGQMALAGMAGRAMAGTTSAAGAAGAGAGGPGRLERIRERIGGTTREPAEPPPTAPGGPITGIATELRELASLRDAGILTEEEFTEQKRRLLPP